MKIIQWLKERDASHFVVIEKFHLSHGVSEKMDNLLRDKKIAISYKTFDELNSSEDAAQLIDETNKLAPIDSIFFVSMVSVPKNHEKDMPFSANRFSWKIITSSSISSLHETVIQSSV